MKVNNLPSRDADRYSSEDLRKISHAYSSGYLQSYTEWSESLNYEAATKEVMRQGIMVLPITAEAFDVRLIVAAAALDRNG